MRDVNHHPFTFENASNENSKWPSKKQKQINQQWTFFPLQIDLPQHEAWDEALYIIWDA
jgi:hypothetical protein